MSLNFDLTEVRERLGEQRYAELTTSPETRDKPQDEQKWHPVTNYLIWQTMIVDLGEISEKNVDEWCFRVALLHRLSSSEDLVGGVGKFNVNRADIVNHIGLRTNVTTRRRAQWLARIFAGDNVCVREALQLGGMMPMQEPSAAERVNKAVDEYRRKLTDPEADVVE